jgi:hypothetical protein
LEGEVGRGNHGKEARRGGKEIGVVFGEQKSEEIAPEGKRKCL